MRRFVVTTKEWANPPLPGSTVDIDGRPYLVIEAESKRLVVEEK